jgi:hypothetical protein
LRLSHEIEETNDCVHFPRKGSKSLDISMLEAKGSIDPNASPASILALDRHFQAQPDFSGLGSSRSSGSKAIGRVAAEEEADEQLENPSDAEGKEPAVKKPRGASKAKAKAKAKSKYEKCVDGIIKLVEDFQQAAQLLERDEAKENKQAEAALADSSSLRSELEEWKTKMNDAIQSENSDKQDEAGSCIFAT